MRPKTVFGCGLVFLALATMFFGGVFTGTAVAAVPKVMVLGKAPSQAFVSWAESVPKVSSTGRACWSGVVVFEDRDFPEATATIADVAPGAPCGMVIARVTLKAFLSEEDARYFLRAETLGRYPVLEWWVANQGYLATHDPEFDSWADGMAYSQLVAKERSQEYAIKLVSWDGFSRPSCQHLQMIQNLQKIGFVLGSGVDALAKREGCQ